MTLGATPDSAPPSELVLPDGRKLAYHRTEGRGEGANAPGVVFLGGFRSDMDGTKALALEEWAKAGGRTFLRFDYTGHGKSSGEFLDGSIGDWALDAMDAVGQLTTGPQILVGSSMGGWVSLLLARRMPNKVAALIGIAAAPDFTEDSMWADFTDAQKTELAERGRVELPSDYSDEPYVITRRLIEDGRDNLVLREPLSLPFPVRLLQGTEDIDVKPEVALRLLAHMDSPDARLQLVKGADHRFSEQREIEIIKTAIEEVTGAIN